MSPKTTMFVLKNFKIYQDILNAKLPKNMHEIVACLE